jgi:atypical dual specificity phosphatase
VRSEQTVRAASFLAFDVSTIVDDPSHGVLDSVPWLAMPARAPTAAVVTQPAPAPGGPEPEPGPAVSQPAPAPQPDLPFASCILAGDAPLYLGGLRAARDAATLAAAGVTHVVDLTAVDVDHEGVRHPGVEYCHVDIQDLPREDLGATFARTAAFIHAARGGGGGVLVHCHFGKSRSVCTAMAYLVLDCGHTLRAAYDLCKAARPEVDPNAAFIKQLSDLERRLHPDRGATLDPAAYAADDLWGMVCGGLIESARGVELSRRHCEAALAAHPVTGRPGSAGLVSAMCWLEEMPKDEE